MIVLEIAGNHHAIRQQTDTIVSMIHGHLQFRNKLKVEGQFMYAITKAGNNGAVRQHRSATTPVMSAGD